MRRTTTGKVADLHVHTFYSDSTFSPEQVVETARDRRIDAIAICDHDAIDGIAPCEACGKARGVEIIPGVEMTVEKEDAEIHILGYFVDTKNEWFVNELKKMQEARVERLHRMVDCLKKHDIFVDAAEVMRLSGPGSVGRLHLAQIMLKNGSIAYEKEAFEKYIGFGKPCYSSHVRFTPEEAFRIIRKGGGVPVIAHPGLMGKDEYIEEFVSYGLRGIEVYHTDHSSFKRRHYEELARRLGLIMTGGSDCHGYGKGRILMGGVKVPYAVVDALREESESIRSYGG